MSPVKTPCVGICSTVFGDEVCRGCKRFVHEVIDWNRYNDEQKKLVKERLEHLSAQVLNSKLKVLDRRVFAGTVRQVEVSSELSLIMQVLEVLRKSAKQMRRLEDHGLQALPEYRGYSPYELKELIDAEIHVLATATYHKNFKPRHHLVTHDEPLAQTEGEEATTREEQPDLGGTVKFNTGVRNDNEVQVP